jgi:hypothetical protein
MTNNNTTKENNMTKKFLTAKETEGMTLEQFQTAMREGRVGVRRESMDNVTTDMVTMDGKYSCD